VLRAYEHRDQWTNRMLPVRELLDDIFGVENFVALITFYAAADRKDLFLAPYYGWPVKRLLDAIRPDTSMGEESEVPRTETSRGPGSTAEVDFWTSKEVCEVLRCHLNYVVADTHHWSSQRPT